MSTATVADISHWIGGKSAEPHSRRRLEVTDPSTGEVIRAVVLADAEDVDRAVQCAHDAFEGWQATTPLRRARILTRFRELLERHQIELATLVSEEHGKVLLDAKGSVQRGIEVVEFACGAPHLLKGEHSGGVGRDVDAYSRLQPLGVCVGITPFNFPAMVPLWMFPVALACGNTFVLKPSEKVPSASMRMAELLREAGLPDGVFNIVHGDKEAVDALLVHPNVRAVSFVGSTPVARHVYTTAAAAGKRVQALGGAKNHAVVMPDADLEFTADALTGAAFGSAGERCMAISVAVAVGDIADALVARLAEKARSLVVGPGKSEASEMGPLVSRVHRDRVRGYVDAGVAAGATPVVDGRDLIVNGHEKGFFLGPTIFDHVTEDMSIYRDEIFGPVLAVVRVETLDNAIDLLNRNPYGNGCAIFTRSGASARRFEELVEVGMVGINVPIPVPMAFFSFGGWKQSLFGDLHVHGMEAVYFYTRTKAVTSRWPHLDRCLKHDSGVSPRHRRAVARCRLEVVMTQCIRIVSGVAAAVCLLSVTLGAQQPMSPAEADAVKKEATAHIDKYYRLFSEQKPDVLASEVFNIPWLVIGGSGPQADLTKEEAQARFQASMKQLVESGWSRSVFTTENVCVLNANAAIASGYNTRYKTDGTVMSVGGVTYILGKSKEGWRIVSYSGHPRGKIVRCD